MAQTAYDQMSFLEQVEAMQMICNIQAMEASISGKVLRFEDLADKTLQELVDMQEDLIPKYNDSANNKRK